MEAQNVPLFSLNTLQFETLLRPIIQKAVAEAVLSLQPGPNLEPSDTIYLDEAMEVTRLSKSHIYRLTHTREIPYSKRGKTLVFSRKALLQWTADRTIEQPLLSEVAADHLKNVASKR